MSDPIVRPEIFDGLLACREVLDVVEEVHRGGHAVDEVSRLGVLSMLCIIRADALRGMVDATRHGHKTEVIATADMLSRWLEVCSTVLTADELADPVLIYREVDDLVAMVRRKWGE
jgi:hypothetical protein